MKEAKDFKGERERSPLDIGISHPIRKKPIIHNNPPLVLDPISRNIRRRDQKPKKRELQNK
jgi:hypothetical protein